MKKKGFTLIELLVVIAVIALLMAIIIPSLQLAKQKAASIVCMSNLKNLSLGWFMYKEDHGGRLMSARMNGTEDDGHFAGWTGTPCDRSGDVLSVRQTDPPVTDEDEIRGLEKGLLWPYVKEPDAYNCPSDRVKSKYDGTEKFVTYSIASCLYGFPDSASSYYKRQIRRYREITSPSMRYVFIETAEQRNWNEFGRFSMGAPEYTGDNQWAWRGPMAVNHGDSSVLGFCDGHAERQTWQDPFTKERIEKLTRQDTDLYDIDRPPEGQVTDLAYMARGWAWRMK